MCVATGEAAAENLYETLHFQHSLVRLLEGRAWAPWAVLDVDYQLGA
jgi:hypothetical protein